MIQRLATKRKRARLEHDARPGTLVSIPKEEDEVGPDFDTDRCFGATVIEQETEKPRAGRGMRFDAEFRRASRCSRKHRDRSAGNHVGRDGDENALARTKSVMPAGTALCHHELASPCRSAPDETRAHIAERSLGPAKRRVLGAKAGAARWFPTRSSAGLDRIGHGFPAREPRFRPHTSRSRYPSARIEPIASRPDWIRRH